MKVVYPEGKTTDQFPILEPILIQKPQQYRSRFLVNKGTFLIKINVEDVAFFYMSNGILYAVNFSKEEFRIDLQIKNVEEDLNPDIFRRVNRQVILNVNSIYRIEPYFNGKLVVKTIPEFPTKIIVSKQNAKPFKDWIDQ
ncbi:MULTISPECIES: LytR/AlgR family response regulator transcription factor [unclassified Saccharicrinis]|uniref:LytR/AlgR family response regulator transcription factor n=1 Tax=unclassified Saccharicrinis TaxID=2646859 RepID=UPI003D331714